jgi:hypothetical protein
MISGNGKGRLQLALPWMVIDELDHLKTARWFKKFFEFQYFFQKKKILKFLSCNDIWDCLMAGKDGLEIWHVMPIAG